MRQVKILIFFAGMIILMALSEKLGWPAYIVGGVNAGFLIRFCAMRAVDFQSRKLGDVIVACSFSGVIALMVAGSFEIKVDASYIEMAAQLACPMLGAFIAGLLPSPPPSTTSEAQQ